MPFAKNIRYCRNQNKLSQKEFADIIGVAQTTVHSWECRRTFPDYKIARRIAAYFHVPYEEFCDIDLEKRDSDLTGGNPLTIDEIQSVLKFRALSSETKAAIRAAISTAYDLQVAQEIVDVE